MLVTVHDFDYGSKVGFVDDNGVCLQFALGQESGWFVAEADSLFYGNPKPVEDELDDYFFDPYYMKDLGSAYSFRIVAERKRDLYLVIYNNRSGLQDRVFMFKAPEDEPVHGVV